MKEKPLERITLDPQVMCGKPVIKGTRIPVDAVIQRIAEGMSFEDIIEDYPKLTKADIKAALNYGASLARGEYTIPSGI
jgi:uncharacterized protein (DUF433 family)